MTGTRTHGMTLHVLAAASELRERPRLLRESVAILEASGDRLLLASALVELSRTYQTIGDSDLARTTARRAWRLATECRAEVLYRDLTPRFHKASLDNTLELRATVPGLKTLTDAERRVAALAAVGYTNREISGKLYITISTVEQHLTRIYRKLNVRQRSDLPTSLLNIGIA
jgi:DNA-binding CsgD family transcriptional regulator